MKRFTCLFIVIITIIFTACQNVDYIENTLSETTEQGSETVSIESEVSEESFAEEVFDPTPRDLDCFMHLFQGNFEDEAPIDWETDENSFYYLIENEYELYEIVDYASSGGFRNYSLKLPKGFFDSKALIITAEIWGSCVVEYRFGGARANENGVTVEIIRDASGAWDCALQPSIFVAELNKADIAACPDFEVIFTDDIFDCPIVEEVNYNTYIFTGVLEGVEEAYGGNIDRLFNVAVTDEKALEEKLTSIYSYADGGENFLKFAQQLPENYFDEKTLIAAYSIEKADSVMTVDNVAFSGISLRMNITRKLSEEENSEEYKHYLYIIEVDKGALPKECLISYDAVVETVKYESEPREIDFTEIRFEGKCENVTAVNAISVPYVSSYLHSYYISDRTDIDQFFHYIFQNNEIPNLEGYFTSLPDEFFRDNVILASFYTTVKDGAVVEVEGVSVDNEFVRVDIAYDKLIVLDDILSFDQMDNIEIICLIVDRDDVRGYPYVRFGTRNVDE